MDNFYIFLPSNSPVEGNVAGEYTVRLPNTIDLSDGEWSVALSSIIYPISYQSSNKKEMFITINYYEKPSKTITIPAKDITFKSIDHLQKILNDTIIIRPRKKRNLITEDIGEREKREDLTMEQRQMIAAKNEVTVRSYELIKNLDETINDYIVEVEAITSKIEYLQTWITVNAKPNADFLEQEITDIIKQLKDISSKADKIRSECQNRRINIVDSQTEFGLILDDFDQAYKTNNLVEARKAADKAKHIVERLKTILNEVSEKLKVLKILQVTAYNKYEEVVEYMQPLNTGLKNNINRIKQTIIQSLPKEQLAELEVYFYYDENLSRFFLYNHKLSDIKSVSLSPRLAYILGFEIDPLSYEIKRLRMRQGGGFAKYSPDISSGIHQLYVYCPGLIESSFVGNKQAPLLRIVNVEKTPNTVAESIYTNMYFMKVIEKRISSIKIVIKDAFNDTLKFNWGNVIVTLAFRKSLF